MAALIIAGGALSAYGAIRANEEKADAQRRDAAFYDEQAQYAQLIGEREELVFKEKAEELRARQIGSYAKAGVDLSGSPLLILEQQSIRREQEIRAIRQERDRRVRLARLRQTEALGAADRLTSFENQFLSVTPTILSTAGSAYKAGSS